MQSITYILIVLFVLISGNNGDKLKFCNFIRDKSPDLVSTINCDEKIIEKKPIISAIRNTILCPLIKKDTAFETTAFVCKISKLTYLTYQYFWSGEVRDYEPSIEVLVLSAEDCYAMIYTKSCYNNKMKRQIDETYYYKGIPLRTYSRFVELSFVVYDCLLSTKAIVSNNVNSVLPFAEKPCPANQGYCVRGDFTFVWNTTITNCSYRIVNGFHFEELRDLIYYSSKSVFQLNYVVDSTKTCGEIDVNSKHIDEKTSFIVKLKETKDICGVPVTATSLNMYLVDYKYYKQFESIEIDNRVQNQLIAAESDSKTIILQNELIELSNKINHQACSIFKNQIEVFKNWPKNRYYQIHDSNGKEIVLFNDQVSNELIICKCIEIDSFEVVHNLKECFNLIQITFQLNNTTVDGFLDNNNIIVLNAVSINCTKLTIIQLQNGTTYYRNNLVITEHYQKHIFEMFNNININASNLNFEHIQNEFKEIEITHVIESLPTGSVHYKIDTNEWAIITIIKNVASTVYEEAISILITIGVITCVVVFGGLFFYFMKLYLGMKQSASSGFICKFKLKYL